LLALEVLQLQEHHSNLNSCDIATGNARSHSAVPACAVSRRASVWSEDVLNADGPNVGIWKATVATFFIMGSDGIQKLFSQEHMLFTARAVNVGSWTECFVLW
jgi:hypothetical protein